MSLNGFHIALVALLAVTLLPAAGSAQTFSEAGVASGTGLTFLPTPGIAPVAHWRASFERIDYTAEHLRGMNVLGLGYGLSTNVEGYVRLTSEQLGTISSLISYGFGFKAALPIEVPVLEASGAWFETSVSEVERQSPFFPPAATRGGLTASIGSPAFRALFVGGVSSVAGDAMLLAGAGVTWAPASAIQLGAEVLHGYADPSSIHAMMDLSVRVISNVLLVASPGYITTDIASTWTVSAGLCISTADIDFRPAAAAAVKKGEYTLPSLEDIIKDSSEEKKQ
jgi:hypothetical protein